MLGIALAAAAIDGYEQAESVERTRLRESGRGGRPHVRHEPGQVIGLTAGDRPYKIGVACTGADRYRVRIDDAAGQDVAFDAALERLDEHLSRLTVNGRAYRLAHRHPRLGARGRGGRGHPPGQPGRVRRAARPGPGAGGRHCRPRSGAEVSAGSPVLVLESMKMETVLRAPFDARMRELLVSVGSQVESGAPLARLEADGDG